MRNEDKKTGLLGRTSRGSHNAFRNIICEILPNNDISVLAKVMSANRQKSRGFHRGEDSIDPGAVVATLVVACFPHWWGGWSFGPRLHAGHLGTYFLLLIPLLLWLQEQKPWPKWTISTLCTLACLWGLFVHGTAVGRVDIPLWKGPPEIVHLWNRYPTHVDQQPERGLGLGRHADLPPL